MHSKTDIIMKYTQTRVMQSSTLYDITNITHTEPQHPSTMDTCLCMSHTTRGCGTVDTCTSSPQWSPIVLLCIITIILYDIIHQIRTTIAALDKSHTSF